MNLNLSGKTAIVAGSTQGIGKASAIELALLGANVILLARNQEKLVATLNDLPNNGKQKHYFIAADFSNPEELKIKITDFLKIYGKIQILVNNTGGPPAGKAIDATVDEFYDAFRNHLVCNHILVQAVVEGMKESKYGRIINVISTSVKQPLPNLGVSNTIRAAVGNWSKTLANELGVFGITVNNVLPGPTNTVRLQSIISNKSLKTGVDQKEILQEMKDETKLGRIGEADEIAAAVAFLASPAAAYITGINLPVDGGRTASL
jgi:3-oxoacyl-[acyl-carrier protein] reductase